MFDPSVSEDLSNKSATSTQPRRSPFLFSSLIIFRGGTPGSRQRGWPVLFALPSLRLASSLDVKIIREAGSPLYFATAALMDLRLFLKTIFFSRAQQYFTPAVRIRAMGIDSNPHL